MKIHILLTGGTIDKHYIESNGKMNFANSHIADILEQGRNRSEIEIEQVIFKDSLDITPADLALIAKACASSKCDKVLVTHGTDTMVNTARYITKNLPELAQEKCIVFVGAMIPHVISYSESTFNIGFALGALSAINNGIYIAMNGQIFNADNVKKNTSIGEFQLP